LKISAEAKASGDLRSPPPPAAPPLRFGVFQLDVRTGEPRNTSVLVGLQEQSVKVLAELLERPGDLVTASSCASGRGQR
jgi:hypothetical protein